MTGIKIRTGRLRALVPLYNLDIFEADAGRMQRQLQDGRGPYDGRFPLRKPFRSHSSIFVFGSDCRRNNHI